MSGNRRHHDMAEEAGVDALANIHRDGAERDKGPRGGEVDDGIHEVGEGAGVECHCVIRGCGVAVRQSQMDGGEMEMRRCRSVSERNRMEIGSDYRNRVELIT